MTAHTTRLLAASLGVTAIDDEHPLTSHADGFRYRGFLIAEHRNSGGTWWSHYPEDRAERNRWDATDPDGRMPDARLLAQALDAIDSFRDGGR